MKKCKSCIIAFHVGHSPYTKKQYLEAKDRDDLDCCGGTMILNYCPVCGHRNKKIKDETNQS
jgi:hypothetical protein